MIHAPRSFLPTRKQVLLGGTIGFFQSLCLLGYCLFPMDVAAIVCVTVDLMLVRCGAGSSAGLAGWGWQRRLRLARPAVATWWVVPLWWVVVLLTV